MNPAPIVLFVYNRLHHTQQVIDALQKNALAAASDLFIYSDGPGTAADEEKVQSVRKYVHTVKGFNKVEVITREKNYGLANNIIEGVTAIVNRYGRIIVMEDDLVTSPYFLEFMNEGLEKYANATDVISIHGFTFPIPYAEPTYFLRGADCWGWATWKRGWQLFNPDATWLMQELQNKNLLYQFNFNGCYDFSGMLRQQIAGKINSWAIRWHASAFLHNKITLYPGKSLVQNIGTGASGTHFQHEKDTKTIMTDQRINLPDIPLVESKRAYNLLCRYYFRRLGLRGKINKLLKWAY